VASNPARDGVRQASAGRMGAEKLVQPASPERCRQAWPAIHVEQDKAAVDVLDVRDVEAVRELVEPAPTPTNTPPVLSPVATEATSVVAERPIDDNRVGIAAGALVMIFLGALGIVWWRQRRMT